MALSSPDKEMRMPTSLAYNPLIRPSSQSLDQHRLIQQPKSRSSNPDRFSDTGATAGDKLKIPPEVCPTRYRECLKNHAANVGGNVIDGCGEFMPSGDDGTLEALKCAACNCHRNFHRKEPNGGSDFTVHPLQLPPPLPSPTINTHRPISMGIHNNPWTSLVPPVKMAFGGGSTAATDSSSEELNFNAAVAAPPPFVLSKKRFRTKFTQEQKEKMMEFAEKVGWRIPREDDAEVQRFCGEIGVKRQVLKVWMHNNKYSVKKQLPESNGNGD